MDRITDAMLDGACEDQRVLFNKLYPDGVPVTIETAMEARAAGLDVLWLQRLLPKPLRDEYEAKCKPLDDEYEAKCKPLDDEYWAKRINVLIPLLRMA